MARKPKGGQQGDSRNKALSKKLAKKQRAEIALTV